MGVACPKCGNEDLRFDPISRFRLGIPHLSDLQQAGCRAVLSAVSQRLPIPDPGTE